MTILETFKDNVSKTNVIRALQTLNEYILDKDIDLSLESEILEFGDFFVDNYEDDTYDERIKEFGEGDALILQLYDCISEKAIEENEFFEDCENILISIGRAEQQELDKVYDDIMLFPGMKNIYIEYMDGFNFSCELEETLTRDQELELRGVLAKAINDGALLLIELIDKKIVTAIFFKDKEAKVISKAGIKKIHNINPYTGEKVKQKGFTYIETNKLIEKILSEK